jgi:cytochrome P450
MNSSDRSQTSRAAAAPPLPPGPRGNFLLGNMPEMLRDSLGFLTAARRDYGDVARLRLANRWFILINNPDGVKHVLQENNHNYGKGAFSVDSMSLFLGNGLLLSEGDLWLRQRRLMQPVFHRRVITGFADQMVTQTRVMLDEWDALTPGQPVDVAQAMMRLTLDIATQALFSTRVKDDTSSFDWALTTIAEDINFRFMVPFYPAPVIPTPRNRRLMAALKTLESILFGIIDERRRWISAGRELPDDLLTLLMQAQDPQTGEKMSDRQVRDEVATLFAAGHETTAVTLAWCWHLLSLNPEVERRFHAELAQVLGGRDPSVADLGNLPYTRMLVDETLRLYPPAWVTNRQALAEDEIGGWRIPAGGIVWLSPYVMHRHPAYWADPDHFDPLRFSPENQEGRPRFAYYPFGGGPHQCIGQGFALMETPLILATIAQRYRLLAKPGHLVTPEPMVTLRLRGGLPMLLHRTAV